MGMKASAVNLANSVIGVGNLALPQFMRNFGVLLTIVLFGFTYWLMYSSCRLLLKAKKLSLRSDYTKIALNSFGISGIISHLAIITYNFGMCVSFVIIYFSVVRKLFVDGFNVDPNEDSLLLNKGLQSVVIVSIILPFLFARSTEALKWASSICFISHVLFTFVSLLPAYLDVLTSLGNIHELPSEHR